MTKVSFIVPVYNQPDFFPTCLDAIWFQDYPDIEIVLINDGSGLETRQAIDAYLHGLTSDTVSYASNYHEETGEISRTFHRRYPSQGREIKVLEHAANRGLGAALNTGFMACTGTYCTYIACDDYPYPSMLRRLTEAMARQGADFAYADMNIVDSQARILRRFALPPYDFEASFCRWYLCGVCKLYKRSLHEELGWYREDLFSHDHELYLRFAMHGAKFVHVAEPLAAVRFHDTDRLVDNHRPESWSRLMDESRELVVKARQHARSLSS